MHSLYPPTIGLIAMGQSAPIEHYIHLHLPEGVVAASTRVPYEEVSRPGMKRMIAHLPDAAALLSEAHPSVLIISNFIASCLMGQEMINILQQTVGVPVIVPGQAYVSFLRRHGKRRLAILSSFGAELNTVERIFFARNDIQVVGLEELEHQTSLLPAEVSPITPDIFQDGIQRLPLEQADALLVDNPLFFPDADIKACLPAGKPLLFMSGILLDAALSVLKRERMDRGF